MRIRFQIMLLASLVLSAQQPATLPPEIYRAFLLADRPIVIGTISEVTPSATADRGTLKLAVREQLRGKPVGAEIVVQFQVPASNPRRPDFLWQRVRPATGKNLLLILTPSGETWQAEGILDLDRESSALPELRQALLLEAAAASNQKNPLLEAMGSPSPFVRGVAIEFLIRKVCTSDAACRSEMLDRTAAIARNPRESRDHRTWAVDVIGTKIYLGFKAGDEVDHRAAMALAGLLGESEVAVRSEAVQLLHGLLVGAGTIKPDVSSPLPGRSRIVEQLKKDAEGGAFFAAQARDLAPLVAKGQ